MLLLAEIIGECVYFIEPYSDFKSFLFLCEFKEFIGILESGRLESENNSLGNSLAVAEVMDEIRRQAGVRFPAD